MGQLPAASDRELREDPVTSPSVYDPSLANVKPDSSEKLSPPDSKPPEDTQPSSPPASPAIQPKPPLSVKVPSATDPSGFRTWTTKSDFTFEGRLLRFQGDEAVIQKTNLHTSLIIPLSELSESDRAFVKERF